MGLYLLLLYAGIDGVQVGRSLDGSRLRFITALFQAKLSCLQCWIVGETQTGFVRRWEKAAMRRRRRAKGCHQLCSLASDSDWSGQRVAGFIPIPCRFAFAAHQLDRNNV